MTAKIDHRMLVLVVEDDQAQARWLTKIVQDRAPKDVEILTLTDSQSAHEYLETSRVDVLITDLDMPGFDGVALIRQAKRVNPWVQSLILTAASRPSALIEAGDVGATDYLLKPVCGELLTELLHQSAARLRRWRSSFAETLCTCHAS